jgi:hypothetical protein
MSFEVTNDTVVKILVRRGLEADRVNTLLTEGELGYSVDNRRLYVGDGTTIGGVVAGNKHLGKTSDKAAYTSLAQMGDLIFSNNENWFYDGDNWLRLDPDYYNEPTVGKSIEKTSTGNLLRVAPVMFGQGLSLDYSEDPNGYLANTIQQQYGKLQFDARYFSLCASALSFYFGNIFNKTVKNNLNATVNISDSLFLNDSNSNPYQIKAYAQNPSFAGKSTIESISGAFVLKGRDTVGLLQGYNFSTTPQIAITNSGQIQFNPNISSQNYNIPGTQMYGVTRLYGETFIDDNLTVAKSLSVLGNISYLDTIVSITSSLSVVNTGTGPAFTVKQTGPQPIAKFYDDNNIALIIVDTGSVGINTGSPSYKLDVNGTGRFTDSIRTNNDLTVDDTATITGRTYANGGLDVTGSCNLNSGCTITGALNVTGDITAFYSSDKRFKDNIQPLDLALEKIDKISGVSFDWNSNSAHEGHDIGVIAQEIEEVLPEVVTTRSDGYKAVRYEKIIPLLIEGIKELHKLVKCQK